MFESKFGIIQVTLYYQLMTTAYGRPIMARQKKSEHYVNNKEFLNALENYFAQVEKAKLNDQPKPQIPKYIGECFLKIANHLSYKPNFVNYMFKDDMICDGIENCVRYIHNFNPEKSRILLLTSSNHLLCFPEKNPTGKETVRDQEQNP